MKVKRLSNKEVRALSNLTLNCGVVFKRGDEVYSVEFNNVKCFVFEGRIFFFYYNDRITPSLHVVKSHNCNLRNVFVDMGAVKSVINGADIMRPGVVRFDKGIAKDEIVTVRDVINEKPLCVGVSLYSEAELDDLKKGKVVKNIHYVGDKIWNAQF